MSQKPPFVELEEAVKQALAGTRAIADAMRAENNALRAIPTLEEARDRIGIVLAAHRKHFDGEQKREFDALAKQVSLATTRQINTTSDFEEKWIIGIDAIWALNQIHPNLVAIFNEFRPRMM